MNLNSYELMAAMAPQGKSSGGQQVGQVERIAERGREHACKVGTRRIVLRGRGR